MSTPSFPIVTLEISGMKHAIKAAFTEYLIDMDSDIQAAIDAITSSDNIKRVIYETVEKEIDSAIKDEIQNYFRYGNGKKVIARAVIDSLDEKYQMGEP